MILHGWGLSGDKYEVLAALLSKDFFVIVPDFPGFGKTPEPAHACSVEDYAKTLKEFMSQQNLQNVILLGHSFGGRVSLKLSVLSPTLVKALILSGTPGVERFSFKRSVKRVVYFLAAKLLKLFSFLPPVKALRERFYEKRDMGKLDGIMKQTFLKVVKEDLTKNARNVTQPTLLLWGSRDQMAPVIDAEKILQLIPQSQLKIFAKVGHQFPYEKPHEFAREVMSFAISQHLLP